MFEEETKALNEKIAEIKARYQPQIDQLTADAQSLQGDVDTPGAIAAVINVDIKVEWKVHDFSLDLPAVTMKDRGFSLDLPTVTMNQKHLIFDIPSVCMVEQVVGYKPEFRGLEVKITPIIISVPQPCMKRIDISTDIPEFKMERQDFVLGVPEFKMERQDFSLTLPEFTIIKVSAQAAALESRGNDLMARGQAIGQAMKAEIDAEVNAFKQKVFGQASSVKTDVSTAFDTALIKIGDSINTLVQKGCDPIKVPTDSGDVNLRKMYDELSSKKSETIGAVDEAIKPIVES